MPDGYDRVMRFVVCDDGTYDPDAFAAGFTAGGLDATCAQLAALRVAGATVRRHVPPALVPQLDLIAMRHGFDLTTRPWDGDPQGWTLATFTTPDTPGGR